MALMYRVSPLASRTGTSSQCIRDASPVAMSLTTRRRITSLYTGSCRHTLSKKVKWESIAPRGTP